MLGTLRRGRSEGPKAQPAEGVTSASLLSSLQEARRSRRAPRLEVSERSLKSEDATSPFRASAHKDAEPKPRPSAFAAVTFKPRRRPDGELKPAEEKAGWETSKDPLDVASDLRKGRPWA